MVGLVHSLLVRLKLIVFKWLSPRYLQRETWLELVMMVWKTSRSNVIIAEKHVNIRSYEKPIHCVKIIQIRSFSGLRFPAFKLNMEIYEVNTGINTGKYRPDKQRIYHAVINNTFMSPVSRRYTAQNTETM